MIQTIIMIAVVVNQVPLSDVSPEEGDGAGARLGAAPGLLTTGAALDFGSPGLTGGGGGFGDGEPPVVVDGVGDILLFDGAGDTGLAANRSPQVLLLQWMIIQNNKFRINLTPTISVLEK